MLLLVGLGNPGSDYARQRHNVGFMVVDTVVRRYEFGAGRGRFQGTVHEGRIAGEKILALKPLTYVNESGRAVASAVRFYKLAPSRVIAIHDDLDLAAGKVRVKVGGGNGGHNGLRSIDAHIGREYRRVRLGIGHPGHRDRVTRHVLSNFSDADEPWLGTVIEAVAETFPVLVRGDDSGFMSAVAVLTRPPSEEADPPDSSAAGRG